jgi:anaerobic ribonucleoside-triphosphate reductase activating protein
MKSNRIRVNTIIPMAKNMGPGTRIAVVVQGCLHNCPGCNSSNTFDSKDGKSYTVEELLTELWDFDNSDIDGITITGGEPFLQSELIYELIKSYLQCNTFKNKTVCIYTGYTFEEILEEIHVKVPPNLDWIKLVNIADYLIDGRFDINLVPDESTICKFRGSTNQRVLNGKESYKNKKPIEYDEYKVTKKEIEENGNKESERTEQA